MRMMEYLWGHRMWQSQSRELLPMMKTMTFTIGRNLKNKNQNQRMIQILRY